MYYIFFCKILPGHWDSLFARLWWLLGGALSRFPSPTKKRRHRNHPFTQELGRRLRQECQFQLQVGWFRWKQDLGPKQSYQKVHSFINWLKFGLYWHPVVHGKFGNSLQSLSKKSGLRAKSGHWGSEWAWYYKAHLSEHCYVWQLIEVIWFQPIAMLRVWCNDTLNDFVALRCTPACLVPCFEITVILARKLFLFRLL